MKVEKKLHFYFVNYIIFGDIGNAEGFYVGTFTNATDAYDYIKKILGEKFPDSNFVIRNFVKVE